MFVAAATRFASLSSHGDNDFRATRVHTMLSITHLTAVTYVALFILAGTRLYAFGRVSLSRFGTSKLD